MRVDFPVSTILHTFDWNLYKISDVECKVYRQIKYAIAVKSSAQDLWLGKHAKWIESGSDENVRLENKKFAAVDIRETYTTVGIFLIPGANAKHIPFSWAAKSEEITKSNRCTFPHAGELDFSRQCKYLQREDNSDGLVRGLSKLILK